MSEPDSSIDTRDLGILDRAIHFCLTNKLVVVLLVLVTVLWGVMVAPFDWDIRRLPRDPVPVDAIPDIMVPMAIPSFGGMLIVLITVFVVPVLHACLVEFQLHTRFTQQGMNAMYGTALILTAGGVVLLATHTHTGFGVVALLGGIGLMVLPIFYCTFMDVCGKHAPADT